MKKSKKIVEAILDTLKDRGGFDGWWGGIDSDIREEIIQELEKVVEDEI